MNYVVNILKDKNLFLFNLKFYLGNEIKLKQKAF